MRGEAEEALEDAENAKENAQVDARKVAHILTQVYEKVGKSRKALTIWARGPDGAGNFPMLAKLGKGANALTEAMRLAQITDAQFAVLPASIASGKGVDTHKARAIASITDGLYQKDMRGDEMWPADYVTKSGAPLPSVECGAAILRRIATVGFGIENPSDYNLDQLTRQVNEEASRLAGEFVAVYGKTVNTYDAEEYGAALKAYGRVTCSEGGDNMFDIAADALLTMANMDSDSEVIAAMVKLYSNNLMFKRAVDSVAAHIKTTEKEERNRDLIKNIVENDDGEGPISKQGAKSFAKLDPLPAAAHLFKLLNTHPEAAAVWDAMRGLVSQQGLGTEEKDV